MAEELLLGLPYVFISFTCQPAHAVLFLVGKPALQIIRLFFFFLHLPFDIR